MRPRIPKRLAFSCLLLLSAVCCAAFDPRTDDPTYFRLQVNFNATFRREEMITAQWEEFLLPHIYKENGKHSTLDVLAIDSVHTDLWSESFPHMRIFDISPMQNHSHHSPQRSQSKVLRCPIDANHRRNRLHEALENSDAVFDYAILPSVSSLYEFTSVRECTNMFAHLMRAAKVLFVEHVESIDAPEDLALRLRMCLDGRTVDDFVRDAGSLAAESFNVRTIGNTSVSYFSYGKRLREVRTLYAISNTRKKYISTHVNCHDLLAYFPCEGSLHHKHHSSRLCAQQSDFRPPHCRLLPIVPRIADRISAEEFVAIAARRWVLLLFIVWLVTRRARYVPPHLRMRVRTLAPHVLALLLGIVICTRWLVTVPSDERIVVLAPAYAGKTFFATRSTNVSLGASSWWSNAGFDTLGPAVSRLHGGVEVVDAGAFHSPAAVYNTPEVLSAQNALRDWFRRPKYQHLALQFLADVFAASNSARTPLAVLYSLEPHPGLTAFLDASERSGTVRTVKVVLPPLSAHRWRFERGTRDRYERSCPGFGANCTVTHRLPVSCWTQGLCRRVETWEEVLEGREILAAMAERFGWPVYETFEEAIHCREWQSYAFDDS